MRTVSWVACLAALCACGDGDSGPDFSLGGAEFHVDFDLDSGPDECPSDGALQFVQTGSQLTGTLNATRHCAGVDSDVSGPITGTVDGTQVGFTAETEAADCVFTGEKGRDGTNEEIRGTVECLYGDVPYTGRFAAFRSPATGAFEGMLEPEQ